ncbi:MAG: M48 family metallopeptidase [Paracoccaceae bacterium]
MNSDPDQRVSFTSDAWFFDGDLARPRATSLQVIRDQSELAITADGLEPMIWPTANVRVLPDQVRSDRTVLCLKDDPVARLVVADKLLLSLLPNKHRRTLPKGGSRLLAWALAAIASVWVIIGALVPTMADQLAVFIPPDGERALGETTLGQIRAALDETGLEPIAFCEETAGVEALSRMKSKLTANLDLGNDVSVHVLDHKMVNAFALPGGFVVLFRGLIDAAESPDEVAAVLAHEIGHVVSRDPTRLALRSAGSIGVLGLLFGDFAGGAVVLFLTERLISAQYSQGAETGADRFAYDALLKSDVSPAALGDMFQRLRDKFGDGDAIVAHFLSHPGLRERIDAARAAAPENQDYQPVLSGPDWASLKSICKE